jgi:hypothetical protein
MQGEYVRGEVHTANLDSFWALLKRGVIGTYWRALQWTEDDASEPVQLSLQFPKTRHHV